jgi:hypothetical protein
VHQSGSDACHHGFILSYMLQDVKRSNQIEGVAERNPACIALQQFD